MISLQNNELKKFSKQLHSGSFPKMTSELRRKVKAKEKGAKGNDSTVHFCFITAKLLFSKLGYCLFKLALLTPPHHCFVTAPHNKPINSSYRVILAKNYLENNVQKEGKLQSFCVLCK